MITGVSNASVCVRRLACNPIGKTSILPVIAVIAILTWATGPANASAVPSMGTGVNMTLRQAPVGSNFAIQNPPNPVPATGLPNPTVGSLGYSVAISGEVAIVGAPGVSNGTGAVFLYRHVGRSWPLQAEFTDPRNQTLDEFGWSVAIASSSAGTYAAVGASAGNGNVNIVYIYQLLHGKWRQQTALQDPGASDLDNFGDSVAITPNTLVVGAPCVGNERGKFYVWLRFGERWVPEAVESNPANKPRQWFGASVSISGNNILVGAVDSAYIYSGAPRHHWHRTATLRNPGSAKDYFGWDVALSGATAAIGAPGGIPSMVITSPLSAGATYVYMLRGNTWSLRGKLTPPRGASGDQFGYSVALAGNSMLIGMPLYGSTGCGKAYEFELSDKKWLPSRQIRNPHCNGKTEFGFAVAQSGSSGALGAPNCNSLHGAVYLRKVS
jgi:FG-GAP repeat